MDGTRIGDFNIIQHSLLYPLIVNSYMDIEEWSKLASEINGGDLLDSGYESIVTFMNQNIFEDEFGLRTLVSPTDGRRYIGFIDQSGEDSISKLFDINSDATKFLKAILIKIAESEDSPLDMIEFEDIDIKSNFTSKNLSRSERRESINKFIREGWLHIDEFERCDIGIRSFLQLRRFLMDLDLPQKKRETWEKFL